MKTIYQTEKQRACRSRAVGARVVSPKGLGSQRHEPLMRNAECGSLKCPPADGDTARDVLMAAEPPAAEADRPAGTSQRGVPTLNGSSVTLAEEMSDGECLREVLVRLRALDHPVPLSGVALSVARKFAMVGYTSNVELSPAEFALYLGASERWVAKHWHSFTERKHVRGGKRWIHLATNQERTWKNTF